MRQSGNSHKRVLTVRLIVLASFVALVVLLCASTRTTSVVKATDLFELQTRRTRPTARPSTPPRPPARDYSKFSHATEGHNKDCATCHLIPSFEKSDLREYPDHPSCVNCHRQQFFHGARPIICSVCHTAVSPRSDARFKFPKDNVPSQFADIFPHVNHVKTTSLSQFKRFLGKTANTQSSCMYCHKVDKTEFKPAANAPKDVFVPVAGTFMTTPTRHATCFECHWQKEDKDRNQEPYANQCSACHRNEAGGHNQTAMANASMKNAMSAATSPKVMPTVAFIKASALMDKMPPRISPKFVHELAAHKTRTNDEGKDVAITCLQCHTSVRKSMSLESLRERENKVQLPTCSTSSCHTALSGSAQLKLSVYRELRARAKDPKFDCALCHLPNISTSADVPCSHYVAVYQTAIKEKKATKGIEDITPQRCAEELKKENK